MGNVANEQIQKYFFADIPIRGRQLHASVQF